MEEVLHLTTMYKLKNKSKQQKSKFIVCNTNMEIANETNSTANTERQNSHGQCACLAVENTQKYCISSWKTAAGMFIDILSSNIKPDSQDFAYMHWKLR